MKTIELRDESSGARAKILTDFGFNCYSFTVPEDGGELEVFWSASGFENGTERPSGSGIPILFPFPGRLKGTRLSWSGRTYELKAGDGLGNAIHGFVHNRPWRVIESSGARIVGQFQASIDDRTILLSWPADFCITATYQLAGTTLRTSYLIENPDQQPLPFGFGLHPYFQVPLGGNSKNDCIVQVPVSTSWLLENRIASGQCETLEDASRFRQGLRFEDMSFDNIFGGLRFDDGVCVARLCDPSGQTLTMTFDEVFQQCVLFNPPHREAICVEPYTCVPDPFRLTREGFEVGLRVLEPGDSMFTEVEIRIE